MYHTLTDNSTTCSTDNGNNPLESNEHMKLKIRKLIEKTVTIGKKIGEILLLIISFGMVLGVGYLSFLLITWLATEVQLFEKTLSELTEEIIKWGIIIFGTIFITVIIIGIGIGIGGAIITSVIEKYKPKESETTKETEKERNS